MMPVVVSKSALYETQTEVQESVIQRAQMIIPSYYKSWHKAAREALARQAPAA